MQTGWAGSLRLNNSPAAVHRTAALVHSSKEFLMGNFILRRLILSIPVLIGILIVTFAMGRLIPGDPCKAMLGERADAQICADFAERYGLNQPLPQQFVIYAGNVLHGDLGNSIRFGRPVTTLLSE